VLRSVFCSVEIDLAGVAAVIENVVGVGSIVVLVVVSDG
jgi:hypothetical protein